MDKYKKYMDSVEPSAEFLEELKGLEKPQKPAVWRKYGAMAAALVLVLGLSALGVSRFLPRQELGQPEPGLPEPAPSGAGTEHAVVPVEPPLAEYAPDTTLAGGYEVWNGETVSYYYLPYIKYGVIDAPVEEKMDMAPPVGVYRRDLTREELVALFGGEQTLSVHLNWSGYEVYAFAMLNRDGSLWRLYVGGYKGDTGQEHFSLEVMPGGIPASCYVYGESVSNQIFGREVRAERYDGEQIFYRRVSFMHEDYGYRFEITGQNAAEIEELVSRMVRVILLYEEPAVGGSTDEVTTQPYDPNGE